MKINTTFNVGDTAYVLENEECYRLRINAIDISVEKDVSIAYYVTKFVPAWILKETEEGCRYSEKQLFLTKWEVKDKLKEIKKHKEKKEDLKGYMKGDLASIINQNYFDWMKTYPIYNSCED